MSMYLPSSLVWLRNTNFQLFVLFDNTIQVLFEKHNVYGIKIQNSFSLLFFSVITMSSNAIQLLYGEMFVTVPSPLYSLLYTMNQHNFVVKSTKTFAFYAMMASSGLIHEDKEQTAQHGCYYLQCLNPRR